MSYYTRVCGICPDKAWIRPGTEQAQPVHETAGLDERHVAVPVDFHSEQIQRRMLARAMNIIRERVPVAAFVDLVTSDQDLYGFVLSGVRDASGTNLLPAWNNFEHPLIDLSDAVIDEISDLDWDGVVGEDKCGKVTIDLRLS